MLNILKNKISTHLNNVFHDGNVEVTLYPTYGFQQDGDWIIPFRGWVHQDRRLPDHLISELGQAIIHCQDTELSRFSSRFDDFTDDSRSNQTVTIQFDTDDEQHVFPKSDLNGLIEMALRLPVAKALTLLTQQGATDNWLSVSVTSDGHSGKGRAKLIEHEGVSLVSDIDDTIKVTEVPGDKEIVLKNTFLPAFRFGAGNGRRIQVAHKYKFPLRVWRTMAVVSASV